MKREGWQHGMVRFNPKSAKHLESEPPAAEAVAFRSKLLPKPTSNSKFTGKCRKARCKSCHYHHPVSKSKDKAKGSYKLKSRDVALNHRLVSWRLVDEGRPAGLNASGVSATALLGSLSSNSWREEDEEVEEEADCFPGPDEFVGSFQMERIGLWWRKVREFTESNKSEERERERKRRLSFSFSFSSLLFLSLSFSLFHPLLDVFVSLDFVVYTFEHCT